MSYTKILLGVFFIAYREFLEMTLIDLAHLTKNALTDDKMGIEQVTLLDSAPPNIPHFVLHVPAPG